MIFIQKENYDNIYGINFNILTDLQYFYGKRNHRNNGEINHIFRNQYRKGRNNIPHLQSKTNFFEGQIIPTTDCLAVQKLLAGGLF